MFLVSLNRIKGVEWHEPYGQSQTRGQEAGRRIEYFDFCDTCSSRRVA